MKKEKVIFFGLRLTKYKGRNIVLSDGTQINKNDTLVKIHLHNVRLLKELKNIKSEIKKAKMIYRYVQKSLPGIEIYIRNHCHSNEIKGIIGITPLNKGCERLVLRFLTFLILFINGLNSSLFYPIGIIFSQNLLFCIFLSISNQNIYLCLQINYQICTDIK